MAGAGWLIGWPILGGDSFSPRVRPCLPDLVWAAASPAPGAEISGCEISWVGHTGLLALPGGVVRQAWMGWVPTATCVTPPGCGGNGVEEMGYLLKEREQEEAVRRRRGLRQP